MKKLHVSAPIGDQQGLNRVLAWSCLALAVLLPVAGLYSSLQMSPLDMLMIAPLSRLLISPRKGPYSRNSELSVPSP